MSGDRPVAERGAFATGWFLQVSVGQSTSPHPSLLGAVSKESRRCRLLRVGLYNKAISPENQSNPSGVVGRDATEARPGR